MASFNPMKAFSSVFEKIGGQAVDTKTSSEANVLVATSVSVGGDLYSKLDEIVNAIKELSGSAKKPDFKELAAAGGGSFSMTDSIALAFLAPTLKPIGKGLGFIVDAINNLEEGGEEKAKALEAIFGTLSNLADVGKAIFGFAFWIALSLPFLMLALIAAPLLAITMKLTIMAINWGTSKLDEEQMEKVAMLGDVGKSILIFTASLALASIIMPWAMKGAIGAAMIILGIGMVFMLLEKMGATEKIEPAAKGLLWAGAAILGLGVALALFSFIEPYAMKGFLSAMLMIAGVGLVMVMISYFDRDFEKAAKGLAWAGIAIMSLGLALWFFNWLDPSAGTFIKALAFVTGFGIAFAIIGQGASEIKDGAQALLWASLSIIVIALTFQLMNFILGDSLSDPANYAGLVLVAGLALGYKIIGMGAKHIKKGALAMIAVGISLIAIAIGMVIMDFALKRNGWELIGQTGALVVGLGLAFAAAGVGALFILPGAAAMVVAGVALITVGIGMMIMGKAFQSNSVKDLVTPVDGEAPIKTLLMAVADGFNMWPWEAVGVTLGAASMTVAGLALMMVAGSLMMFGKAAEKIDLPTIGETIALMIGTLAVPFYKIGSGGMLAAIDPLTGEKTEVYFSAGGFWGGNPVSNGVRAVMDMGKALSNIAGGVQNMANLKFPTGFDKEGKATGFETIGGDAFKKVVINTMMMVGSLASTFAKVGTGGEQEVMTPDGKVIKVDLGAPSLGGLAGFLTGGGDVQKGIHAVMNMGQAITNLAMGVSDMAQLKMPTGFDKEGKATGYHVFNANDAILVSLNTQLLISALTTTFAEVGKNPNAERGFWGGASIIEKGADIVASFGTPLVNLAKGVQDMANLRFANKWDADGKAIGWFEMDDIDKVAGDVQKNTIALVGALTNVFTTIGGGSTDTSNSWWSGVSDFSKGIEIVTMIQEPFSNLATVVGEVSEAVTKYDINTTVEKIKAFISVLTNIGGEAADDLNQRKWLVDSVGATFEKLGESIPAIIDSISGFDYAQGLEKVNLIIDPYTKFVSTITEVADVVLKHNALKASKDIKAFVGVFGGIEDLNPAVLGAKKRMVNAIGSTFTKLGASIPIITSAIGGYDVKKGRVFNHLFIGPVDAKDTIGSYTSQKTLWYAIKAGVGTAGTSMPKIAQGINAIDFDKLVESRKMFEALGVLANGGEPSDILAKMGESLEEALQNLADILSQFQQTLKTQQTQNNGPVTENPVTGKPVTGDQKNTKVTKPNTPAPDMGALAGAISNLNQALTQTGVKISNLPPGLG